MESGYYPLGAEHDPHAPWNEQEPEVERINVDYSCVMTLPYCDINNSNPDDMLGDFRNQYHTPKDLIELLGQISNEILTDGKVADRRIGFWKSVAANCQHWKQTDEDIVINHT